MHYNLAWNSHWIINTRLQSKCLKAMQAFKMQSASAPLDHALHHAPEAWSCPQHPWHQPGQGKGTLLKPPRGLPGPGWAPAGHSEGQVIFKKRKPLLPTLEISFHPYKCPSLPGAMLVALLT